MKKKIFSLLILCCLLLVGCQTSTSTNKTTQSKQTKQTTKTVTVTTSFLQDIVKQLNPKNVKTELIIPAGSDPHLYVAKASDLKKLENGHLTLYHGLHFEGKMVSVLEKKGVAVSKDFDKAQLNTMDEDGKQVTDPHFWFNLTLYKKAVQTVSSELQKLLPEQKSALQKNTLAYLSKLDELDNWIKKELAKIPENSRYLITPHDAFHYFAKAYKMTVHAPQGISTDSEVDNAAMIKTVDLIVKHKVKAIFCESTTSPERMKKLQEAVKAKGGNVNVISGKGKELFSDSLAPMGQKGDNFIDMYKHNVSLMVNHLK